MRITGGRRRIRGLKPIKRRNFLFVLLSPSKDDCGPFLNLPLTFVFAVRKKGYAKAIFFYSALF